MEILDKYKENGYFTSQIYHLLVQKKLVSESLEIIPSDYVKNMKMSTSERLQHLQNIEISNLVAKEHDAQPRKPVLAFSPRLIVFQNFKPNDRIVAKFSVKNISSAPAFLNMVFKECTNFTIKPCGGELLSRLAPGISVTFAVTFVPVQFEDYVHRVSFLTDVDQYVVPLIAIGPRPIFDFPDEIVIPSTPLKVETSVSIGIHNICDIPAGFTISTKCPFSVLPKSAYLFPNQKVELKVSFKTMHLGEVVGKMLAMFETDEVFHIKLIASTHSISIELEKSAVRFLDTYNTMVRQQTYRITNKSNELVTYMCMKNDGVYKDFEDKIKLATIFYDLKDSESSKYRKLVYYDVMSSAEHERVYTRIFYDEIQSLVADETLYFQNMHFSVLPIKGKLWPNKVTELTITFAPKEIGEFQAIVYLDIDGIYDRVPMTMYGTSIPPAISLHVETLDMDSVYINTKYNYEIVAMNKGHINGVIMYKETTPLFGSIISCTPEKHCLRPGEKEIFVISFLNSNQGPYFEELNFVIADTDIVRKLYLKGEVIYPSMTFSVPCLDFEKVSIGVPKTLQVEAINESVVNVKANVKISSDGPEISSITLEDCEASGSMQLETPQWPREFNIDPCNIELEANSRVTIKITLTANLCRANQTSLELELDKSDSPPIILPIRYLATVPEITPAPNIKLRACFLDFMYNYDIIITTNEFWGFYTIEQQPAEATLKVDVGMKRGIIRPNTTLCLPATILTEVLGAQEHTVRMNLFGLSKPIDICHIIANGVRPIVTCTPMTLQWGQTRLLTKTQKTLTLCNDSPVTVYFKAGLFNRDGRWQIDPVEGYIEPESETDLTLYLYLVDADTYTNKAVIQLEKVKEIFVPLSAVGVGTSIVVGPERDRVNLGRHFINIPLTYTVIMENCGTRLHSLEWLEHYKAPKTMKPPPLFFHLEPLVFKIAGGEKIELKITGNAHKVTTIKDLWYLIGSVEGVNKKELLITCPMVAEFVDPKVELSTTQIDLQYDYGPYSEFYKLTDIMTIKNISKLPLYIDVSIKPPFAIIKRMGTYKIDPEDEKMCCCICYDENDLNIQKIINECGPQQSKVFIDCLTMKPIEPLRKGPLHFFQDINKIKMAFNLTHAVEERLEDQEIMKLQIIFDTTKHLTLKSKIYADIMRIKFKGHKNKDAVKIMGRISFPNVTILTPKVDFQCILNGSVESKTIKLQNSTNLLACYNFKWKKCNIGTIPLPEIPKVEYDLSKLSHNKIQAAEVEPPSASTLEEIMPSPDEPPETPENVADTGDVLDSLLIADDTGEVPDVTEAPEPEPIDPAEEFRQMKIKILKKITPMIEMDEDPGFSWSYKFPKMTKYKNLDLNDLFQLIPHRGMLMPNSTQYVHVIFRPTYNVNVRAVLECEVLGGPSEYISITGKSSDLMFKLNSQTLNFKIRSFHEAAVEQLIITNISQLPFEFKTYLNEPVFENDLQATISDIVPPEKIIPPEEEIRVSIMIQPGVVGFFHRVFLLEIGHLPHIPIELFGWGVIPQVYLTLPRPGLENLPTELGYEAIGTLTIDYLEAIQEIFSKHSSEHLNTPQTEKCFEDPEFQVDWHLCSSWDGYPDIMDIELAIERLLAVKHIKQRPEILTMYSTTSKMGPIPGFNTIPYLIDFEVVITGSKVTRTIEIQNYGPLPLKLHFSKGVLNRFGLYYKLVAKMAPGESGRLEILFAPTAADFPELEQIFTTTISIEVPYGVTIPIQIKSLCAVPYLKSNVEKVDFGTVRCGDIKVMSVPLRNVGKPVCIWFVTLKQKSTGPCPTTMMETSGKYEPGEGGWLSISFKPIMEMAYEGVLVFKFHMNPTKLFIPVVGHSVFPHAHIIGPRVVFPPTLPWADVTEIYLGITNPCPFPIELIMAHTDEKWKEEDEMYALLHRYYNKPEEILLPAITPGAGMPPPVQSFFDRFKTNVQKNIEEETALMNKARAATPTKRNKSPKKPVGKAQAEKIEKEATPRKYRTEAEIISDEIKAMKEEELDPLKECLDKMETTSEEKIVDHYAKGLLVFFHGSPCEEIHCKEIAYALGMKLDIPTVSFDMCFIEALCICECPAKEMLVNVINELYENVKSKTESRYDTHYEAEEAYSELEDEFDTIAKKVHFLATSKNVGTPRSKLGDKKKPGATMGTPPSSVMAPGTMFQMELVTELLTEYFGKEKFHRGFIVDSLTSLVLKNAPLVLMTVLKCKHTIWNIHLLLCQSDFAKWALAYEEAQRETELLEEQVTKVMVYDEDEIKIIVDQFEEMDEEEYENADPELKQLYIRHGLEMRKRKYFEKMGMPSDTYTNLDRTEEKSKKAKEAVAAAKVASAVVANDSKKKNKKEEAKGKQSEVVTMQSAYQEYNKSVYEYLINIANNWIIEDCEIGTPLISFNGQIVGAGQKKNKLKKSEVVLTMSEVNFTNRGFPLTLIQCPCLRYKEAVVNMFKTCPYVQQKLKVEEEFDILKHPVTSREYTVLLPKTMPVIHYEESLEWHHLDEATIKKCECNQITDLNLLDDTTQDNVLNILSKWHCICGKKVNSSQTSTSEIPSISFDKMVTAEEDDSFFYPLPLHCVKPIPAPNGRLILDPGDLVRCKITFKPKVEGNVSIKRYVEVAGWPESRVDIVASGICDIPRLDSRSKKMFQDFVRRTVEDNVYKHTYLHDQKRFEFGPIFTGKNRIYEEEYTIDLKNCSLLKADVDIGFLEDTDVFQIDKRVIVLEPGMRGKLKITAAPTTIGEHTVLILFCIKDNPEIVKITVTCCGVVPVVEILPATKAIDYERILLYRREDERFIIKNDSILPIMWKVRNTEDFVEDFIISQTTGIIPRNDNKVVPVTYIACRIAIIQQLPLIIDIYDELGRGEPMVVDTLYLSAESYDVMVECAYENPNENYLNYGNVKVNSTEYREMYLLNRGKYNIYYKLKKVKNFPEPALLKSFEANPETGVVPPTLKLVGIEFQCTPTTSMNLVNVPAYTCSLLDGSKDQVVVAKFPICVTIASFYNTFTLFPLGELNFHVIAVGSGVMRDVILNNTSKCPFNFEIIIPEQYMVAPQAPVQMPKGKDSKLRNPPLKCGNFLIVNEDNLLAPGTSRTISIQFLATGARRFEETIHFLVSDTCPSEAQGVPLRLVGTGAMPTIDFWNLDNTFREHLIVRTLQDYKVPESSPHCVFVEENVTFHFFCVTVNSSHAGHIDLYNNGFVSCLLTMKLHYQANTTADVLSLDKYEMQIDPLMHKRLGIIFNPKALKEYRAVLEVKLKLLHNQEQSYSLCIIGEGVIPRIRLLKPPLWHHRMAVLRFPLTCLGSETSKIIRFKNISTIVSVVVLNIEATDDDRPIFWMRTTSKCLGMVVKEKNDKKQGTYIKLSLKQEEVAAVQVFFNPLVKGRINCDIKLNIINNPYEFFTVLCEAEAFIEDVILLGLEMLSMEFETESAATELGKVVSTGSTTADGKKKSKSAPVTKKRSKEFKKKAIIEPKVEGVIEPAVLKYLLSFGGCEICTAQKRTVIMMNNSEKVYKFIWEEKENIAIKPTVGYISPAEEKDIELMFFSIQPVVIKKEPLTCTLTAISDDCLTMDLKGATWDNRQTKTIFEHNQELSVDERNERIVEEQPVPPADYLGLINIVILYSATTEYTKYECDLQEEMKLKETFIYQKRSFQFKVENVGTVPMKIMWNFYIDDEYPARTDKCVQQKELQVPPPEPTCEDDSTNRADDKSLIPETVEESKDTLVSGSLGRDSVDTWFEVDLPFTIEPCKECLKPKESRTFEVTFRPKEAFDFKVCLKSSIDNLDPYDQNITCKISAKSLIPYVHLDMEESDYLTSGRRTVSSVVLPPHMKVLEFNVLGWGCFRKTFSVINPTNEGYEFVFETIPSDELKNTDKEFVPVHCDQMKGYVEAGCSTEVTFTFAPTAPGKMAMQSTMELTPFEDTLKPNVDDPKLRVYEAQWRFLISTYSVNIPIMVVGFVREPDVVFVPTILVIKNSLVDFTTTHIVILKNNENESLRFAYKGNSICNELGKEPITVNPESGVLRPLSETPVKISYTPATDGPLSFKVFYHIAFMTQYLTLCVHALSYLVKPTVTYYIIGSEHVLDHKVNTRIHLEETASSYERIIPFKIKNSGSAAFYYEWHYTCTPVRKYLEVFVEPRCGHLAPAAEVECKLHFNLHTVPVYEYPVSLSISDGPEYSIQLYAEIQKPLYHFSCKEFDFGKCIINAPDRTNKKNLAFTNDDKAPLILDLNTDNVPELFVDYTQESSVNPRKRLKIPVFFRPKEVKVYEFKLDFWVNSLCQDIITIRGEGVPLLVDLYEGCQKSFDLGPVKVGEKTVRDIEVMNHSKVAINAAFVFKNFYDYQNEDDVASFGSSFCLDPAQNVNAGPSRIKMVQTYRESLMKKQTAIDVKNVLSSIKVVPSKCTIQPHRKVAIKIHFKPVGVISLLKVELDVIVLEIRRPLVLISGSATGMSFRFSQDSLQFGRVRKRGCKVMKVKLFNEGDFGAKFWWQPMVSEEFTVFPMHGTIAARNNVSFVLTYRPLNFNPYVKVWAKLNIENYKSLELALYATCADFGVPQNKTLYMECPTRAVKTEYVVVVNPTDDTWFVVSEMQGTAFETIREFQVEANGTYEIPIHFKPKSIGKHEGQVLFSPLGESALFVTLIGAAVQPDPNGVYNINVPAKKSHTEFLPVYNITEKEETYAVMTELVRVVPEKFEGYYEIKCPEIIKVWGEATATCKWTYICFEPCEMLLKFTKNTNIPILQLDVHSLDIVLDRTKYLPKLMFVNEITREYQFYEIKVQVTPSQIVGTLKFVSRARESVQQEVKVANPLAQEAVFNVKCDKLYCAQVIKVARHSESNLKMTYSPLVVGEFEDYLTIENYIVGTYQYRVVATCLPAKEKTIEVTTSFGNCIPIRLRVHNKSDQQAHFTATADHPAINVEKEYTLPANEKGKFLVWFEPTQLNLQNIKVSFFSSIAGEFVFRIKGTATEPKPQGPFDIKAGSNIVIKFKNVFEDVRTFKITTDREDFYVKSNLEQLKSKKDLKVTVYLTEKPMGGWSEPVTGCLTVETFEPAEPKVQWTYFLQGIP